MVKSTFTDKQAEHASEVVLNLMKNHRFFLPRYDKYFGKYLEYKYKLDPDVFSEAFKLNELIYNAYDKAKVSAIKTIMNIEEKLGIVKPNLSGNKQIVQCNCHTGDLDICQVYPITEFTRYASDMSTFNSLARQCFQQLLEGKTKDDIAPKIVREYKNRAEKLAETIREQLIAMEAPDPENERCVVMMQTRFLCEGSGNNKDFMYGKVWDMQKFPYAMGYLFYEYSKRKRIVRHSHIVFSTSCQSHVNVQHWADKTPTIDYDKKHGYSCPVMFVAVL